MNVNKPSKVQAQNVAPMAAPDAIIEVLPIDMIDTLVVAVGDSTHPPTAREIMDLKSGLYAFKDMFDEIIVETFNVIPALLVSKGLLSSATVPLVQHPVAQMADVGKEVDTLFQQFKDILLWVKVGSDTTPATNGDMQYVQLDVSKLRMSNA
jgi:hypothetical protein